MVTKGAAKSPRAHSCSVASVAGTCPPARCVNMGMSEFGIGETETVTKFHDISWLKSTYRRFSWVIRLLDTNWSLPQDYLGFLVVILTASQLRNAFPHSKNITQLRSSIISLFFGGEWQLWLIAPVLDVIGRCSTTVNLLVKHAPFGAKVAATGLPPVTCPSLTCHDWESCFGFNMLAGLIPHFREIHCVGEWRANATVVPIPYCAVHFLRALNRCSSQVNILASSPSLIVLSKFLVGLFTNKRKKCTSGENALSMGYLSLSPIFGGFIPALAVHLEVSARPVPKDLCAVLTARARRYDVLF